MQSSELSKAASPKISITKRTFLEHDRNIIPRECGLEPGKAAHSTTSSGGVVSAVTTTTQLSNIDLKDLKGIVNKQPPNSPSSSPVSTSGITNYNMAIVAAKRPHLTIVATKPPVVVEPFSPPGPSVTVTPAAPATINASSTTATADTSTESNKMEHSYTRDTSNRAVVDITNGLPPARNVLVRRAQQCSSCFANPLDEQDVCGTNQATVPMYNEMLAKEAMQECARIAKYVKNTNADDDDWESRVNQIGWSNMQKNLFTKVARILDTDQLGRLAVVGRPHEVMQRRVIVDKSAARMRKALASVAWESRLTQWLHSLLLDCLPPSYMSSYLDILQTLKSKLPTLMDKMLFGRPLNISQELLAPVMKKKWEPQLINKPRTLTMDAVIVALPSMPTSGPVPNRLQKWYQHLANITQIVQVTLPMTSGHISRQPLAQVAEQIVSLTRVKIQELRNEKPERSIILVGFNAGAALALQVAMSESVACVVCMGFAYNTYNGVRGTPDDRILDIKVPILFVIGQNSARSSPEEIESLRERMQSESSLVVVGCADDVLRVPKSRRKIENVTQSMVDTMVVEEVYDFIKRVLINPPGPRTPALINSGMYGRHNKSAAEKTHGTSRKRKQDAIADTEATPTKSKHLMGRPRTRPLPQAGASKMHTSTPVSGAKSQQKSNHLAAGNDDLSIAMQSIIKDTSDVDSSLNMSTPGQETKRMVTSNALKSNPMKTKPLDSQKQLVIGGPPNAIGTKIKMLPSNQFVQLKPTSLQSQSKIYTIKTTSMMGQADGSQGPRIGSIVTTTPNSANSGQHIFTLKTPNGQTTQFATAVGSQPKYAVIKNAAGNTSVQLSGTAKTLHPIASTSSGAATASGSYDLSNIIDMPILFADNEGNLSDAVSTQIPGNLESKAAPPIKSGSSSGVEQLIISQQIIKEANSPMPSTAAAVASPTVSSALGKAKSGAIIHPQQLGSKPNKVVFINRNTMKPCTNIISRPGLPPQMQKYTKVVVTNAKSSSGGSVVPRATGRPLLGSVGGVSPSIASTVKQINLQALSSGSSPNSPKFTTTRPAGIINVQTKSLPQIQIINNPNSTLVPTDKPQIRNIVVKSGGLKQLTPNLTNQFLNRNLTVRKLVNIVPASKTTASVGSTFAVSKSQSSPSVTTAVTTTTEAAANNTDPSPLSSTSAASIGGNPTIQTSPKIITLNPVSRTSTPTNRID